MAKIFLVEDDLELCGVIEDWLGGENHSVEVVHNGFDAANRLQYGNYDLAIVDWELPNLSGIEILKRFRSAGGKIPILILTGKQAFENRIEGLDSGADDYLTKPFDLGELSARVRALMRRPSSSGTNILTAKHVQCQTDSGTVLVNGEAVKLLPKEYALLEFFMRHPNELFSPEDLLKRIWPTDTDIAQDNIKTHVNKLRKKIDIGDQPSVIKTVHGFGYKLEV